MRLDMFDRCKRIIDKQHPDNPLKPESYTMFEVSNVAKMVYNDPELMGRTYKEMPATTPPWNACYAEYHIPNNSDFKEEVLNMGEKVSSFMGRMGFFILCYPVNIPVVREFYLKYFGDKSVYNQFFTDKKTGLHKTEGHVIMVQPFWWPSDSDKIIDPEERFIYWLDKDGLYDGGAYDSEKMASFGHEEFRDQYFAAFKQIYMCVHHAFALAHCKNIEIVEGFPPKKIAAKRERKGETVKSFHTIAIDPLKTTKRYSGKNEKGGAGRSFHICRGHYATYTKERPLFGKVTGTFWIPQHVKGNKAVGEVEKDYQA